MILAYAIPPLWLLCVILLVGGVGVGCFAGAFFLHLEIYLRGGRSARLRNIGIFVLIASAANVVAAFAMCFYLKLVPVTASDWLIIAIVLSPVISLPCALRSTLPRTGESPNVPNRVG